MVAKDMLFATLDPTMRGIKLPGGHEVVFSDTVGFIADLPTHLVEAFRATLEEVQLADVILHVRDIAHPNARAQRNAVMDILADLGIGENDERLIEVQNKIDMLSPEERARLSKFVQRISDEAPQTVPMEGLRQEAQGGMVCVSALSGEGVPKLLERIENRLALKRKSYDISVDLSDGAAFSWLHAHGKIVKRRDTKTTSHLKVELDSADYGRYKNKFPK